MTTESAADVQLVFRGEVLHGFRKDDVQRALGERLRIDDDGLARLFTTPRSVLKKSVSPTEAARYIATFARLGAILHAEAVPSEAAPAPAPEPEPEEPAVALSFATFTSASVAPPPPPAPPPSASSFVVRNAEPPQPPVVRTVTPASLPSIEFPEEAPRLPPPPPPAPPPIPAAVAPVAFAPVAPAPIPPASAVAAAPASTPVAAAATASALPGLALAEPPAPVDEVTCPNCQERQPRRVLCRQCHTDIAMALAAKEETRAAERAARQEKRRIEMGLPSAEEAASDAPGLWGLSFQGRLGRLPYWTGGIIWGTVMYLLLVLVLQRPDTGRWILFGLAGLVFSFYTLRWTALRLHDLNASGWWCVVLLVPYVGAAASLALSFVPGASGDNDYGEPPRPGRWRTFGIACGVLLLIVVLTWSAAINGLARMMAEDEDDDLIPMDSAGVPHETMPSESAPPTILQAGPATLNAQGREAFQTVYAAAPAFKAFAASPSGPWGWYGGAGSLSRAAAEAMQQCEAHRRVDQPPCEIIDAAAR